MKKTFKFLAAGFLALVMVAGCASSGTTPTPALPNAQVVADIQAAAQLIGGGAKAFLPLAGGTGTAIDAGIGLFCTLKLGPTATVADEASYMSQVQTQLQGLWTTFNKINTVESNEIVLAINAGWTLASTSVANAGSNLPVAISYLNAFETGICGGYTGTLMSKGPQFWQQYRGAVEMERMKFVR